MERKAIICCCLIVWLVNVFSLVSLNQLNRQEKAYFAFSHHVGMLGDEKGLAIAEKNSSLRRVLLFQATAMALILVWLRSLHPEAKVMVSLALAATVLTALIVWFFRY